MFHIKICGITNPEDAVAASHAGADALGFNFYPGSKRYLTLQNAVDVVRVVPTRVARVGVFVDARAEQIVAAVERLALDWVQLHGNEPPEFVSCIPAEVLLMRACRMGPQGLPDVEEDLRRCRAAGRVPDAVLIDAQVAGEYGGTGMQADWEALVDWRSKLESVPLVLAGGLKPENVAVAIGLVAPAAVDTASGVESAPGRKDPQCMQQFVAAARAAV